MEKNIEFEKLFFGCILGDGYLTNGNHSNYNFCFQHSLKQEEYANYKVELFSNVCDYSIHINKIISGGKFPAIRANILLPKEYFSYLRHLIYPSGNKTVTRNQLNRMDETGLALWYQDDGSLSVYINKKNNKTSRQIKLCTHSYTEKENHIISNYLKAVWDIESTVKIEKEKYFFNHIGAISGNKLFSIITDYVHPSMQYKIDMKYKTEQTIQGKSLHWRLWYSPICKYNK